MDPAAVISVIAVLIVAALAWNAGRNRQHDDG